MFCLFCKLKIMLIFFFLKKYLGMNWLFVDLHKHLKNVICDWQWLLIQQLFEYVLFYFWTFKKKQTIQTYFLFCKKYHIKMSQFFFSKINNNSLQMFWNLLWIMFWLDSNVKMTMLGFVINSKQFVKIWLFNTLPMNLPSKSTRLMQDLHLKMMIWTNSIK